MSTQSSGLGFGGAKTFCQVPARGVRTTCAHHRAIHALAAVSAMHPLPCLVTRGPVPAGTNKGLQQGACIMKPPQHGWLISSAWHTDTHPNTCARHGLPHGAAGVSAAHACVHQDASKPPNAAGTQHNSPAPGAFLGNLLPAARLAAARTCPSPHKQASGSQSCPAHISQHTHTPTLQSHMGQTVTSLP